MPLWCTSETEENPPQASSSEYVPLQHEILDPQNGRAGIIYEGNRYVRDCCLSIISEIWLHLLISDAAIQLVGRTVHQWDRYKDSSKSRSSGLCIYIHNHWAKDNIAIHKHCSQDLESISVKCRPFFLSRELTVVLIMAVYIPPDANTSIALSVLSHTINKLQQAHPDGVHIVAGDFYQANVISPA